MEEETPHKLGKSSLPSSVDNSVKQRHLINDRSTLVNILKTPSRTPRLGTAKNTRTVLAKEKDKENKLRLANAELEIEVAEESRGSTKAKSVSTTTCVASSHVLITRYDRIRGPSFSPRHLRSTILIPLRGSL